ncbi:MAG: hypothetical protein QNJ60_16370 [Xenococcaceae cyanobacterium MO_188.B19]|nr:hypothetical protein [Xenococcaceae cyanobacterium MO_188.B19]
MLTADCDHKFSKYPFHDVLTLGEAAERLGKRAMKLGLISNLTVHLFPDCWQFSLTNGQTSELLTPEEAYLRFKQLLQQFESSAKESQK